MIVVVTSVVITRVYCTCSYSFQRSIHREHCCSVLITAPCHGGSYLGLGFWNHLRDLGMLDTISRSTVHKRVSGMTCIGSHAVSQPSHVGLSTVIMSDAFAASKRCGCPCRCRPCCSSWMWPQPHRAVHLPPQLQRRLLFWMLVRCAEQLHGPRWLVLSFLIANCDELGALLSHLQAIPHIEMQSRSAFRYSVENAVRSERPSCCLPTQ